MSMHAIRVLVVDDSSFVRSVLSTALGAAPDVQVVGTAADAFAAGEMIRSLKPDVITLDIDMPGLDGLTFLGRLMHSDPLPVIIVSSLGPRATETALRALELGALDVVRKPAGLQELRQATDGLIPKVRAAARARHRRPRAAGAPAKAPAPARAPLLGPLFPASRKVLAMGASTGGTEALREVLGALPADMPATVIVQHMPEHFTGAFARRLDGLCAMQVREARHGDRLRRGLALLAPGDLHMIVQPDPDGYSVALKAGPPVQYHRPAVDVLFRSVARVVGANAVGVILTGMGGDGARGMLAMKQAGAHNIAQDRGTCVVYGMPKEAVDAGGVHEIAPLEQIPERIIRALAAAATVDAG